MNVTVRLVPVAYESPSVHAALGDSAFLSQQGNFSVCRAGSHFHLQGRPRSQTEAVGRAVARRLVLFQTPKRSAQSSADRPSARRRTASAATEFVKVDEASVSSASGTTNATNLVTNFRTAERIDPISLGKPLTGLRTTSQRVNESTKHRYLQFTYFLSHLGRQIMGSNCPAHMSVPLQDSPIGKLLVTLNLRDPHRSNH